MAKHLDVNKASSCQGLAIRHNISEIVLFMHLSILVSFCFVSVVLLRCNSRTVFAAKVYISTIVTLTNGPTIGVKKNL